MTVPTINFWAVLLATASTMVVGSLWYTPRVFGEYWMTQAKVDRDTAASRGVLPILVTVAVSFVTAMVLAGAITIAFEFYQGTFLVDALVTGVVLWAGFTAARMITHDAFEARPAGLTTVNVAHELITVLVMSLVIGLIGI
ncbi:DUF1761 domain-containing protein [Isoptericola sp. b441]|uniref:DUF1761 domain-containing protein n=1 Tax=Actinotalea lenta TaxID=3064654 RepID=A0ABT9D7N3_9CELL|nr:MULTISPECIES: DUF1761 domain-containing protein [unclassified Isoptericola]MDO8106860.1 DUF1761 domain-containing protein [Isoptericola sp. b441]MDO8121430.1 DUF1761 domain-containing protein [Isoptericola sp. b490]